MPTSPKSLRLRPELRAEIERIAKRSRRSFSEVAQDLLEEALRMRACPGIYFADEPAGRVAKVAGTGLGVWEIMRDYLAEGAEKVKEALPQVGEAELKAALMYYKRYRQEIDSEIAENAALTPEAVEAKYPGLLRKA
jgi:uncharacterized protein (DUF433 family)